MHTLRRRDHWNYSWKYWFFLRCCQSTASGISKLVGAVFVPTSKQRERSTYTIIRSRNLLGNRSLAILLPPALSPFFSFIPKLFFKTFLVRLPPSSAQSSANSLRIFSARLDSAVTAIFFLPPRVPTIHLHLLSFSLAPIVSSENFKSEVR